ncbi:L,D-transpeptidase [Clostridium paraputrificum]|uniref:L,D-transpeptidase n=1 Tax=Clostridium TaxID=1485 RepID=UPI003D326550
MKKKNSLTFTTHKIKKSNIKLYLSFFLILTILGTIIFYEIFSYKILIKDFMSYFDQNKFSTANNLLLTNENLNPLKSIFMEKDLSTYFSDKIETLSSKVEQGEISERDALTIITEINRYNLIQSNSDTPVGALSNYSNTPYGKALSFYNSGKYSDAYSSFLTIKPSDENYNNAISYLDKCKSALKSDTFKKVDALCLDNYYTKSLELIDGVSKIIGSDNDILAKVEEVKNQRADYLAKENDKTQAASASILSSLSNTNINTLGLESITSYLIHVDIPNQKTYIYKGSKDKWQITKTFTCSTGIEGEETPQGIYTIKEKGKWFFSDKYQQGGKYWVQFYGDYLFHSLPYDKTQSNVVDYTLGKPSSHGCIRLPDEDSKWIYDTIPAGSKVIIK